MQVKNLTHIDLFAGIGGFSLAWKWCGGTTIQFVEIDPFCQKVLQKNFPGVRIHDDIKTFKWTGDTPFILTGGFPCQPFSCAGKRRGKEDDRAIWPEMLRVISEARPTWVIGENVAGIINMELDQCISDLEGIQYEVQTFIIPACAVNAPHRRDRVWIVANSKRARLQGHIQQQTKPTGTYCGCSEDCHAPDTARRRWEQRVSEGQSAQDFNERDYRQGWTENWLEVAGKFCGIFNGLSDWLDRNGGLDGKISDRIRRQDLPYLWQYIQQKKIWQSIGGQNSILNEENLFAILWQCFAKSDPSLNLRFESEEVQTAFLYNVWGIGQFGCPPQGWEYKEQRTEELADTLPQLSHEIALATVWVVRKYNSNRVSRLKALGNAILPQIVYQIMKAIVEIEQCTEY